MIFSRNTDDEEYEDDYEEEYEEEGKSHAVAILSILALLCAIGLGVLIVLIPFFRPAEEDPEALMHPIHKEEESILQQMPEDESYPIDEIPQETTEPTIPPEANPYTKYDFQYNRDNYLICQKQDSYPGVDVSAFQNNIRWQEVADSGIRFAMVRLGFRGYGAAGKMVEDSFAKKNLKGAREAGLAVGAYFFSQATSIREVDEEIEFLLNILGDFELDMPIVLDWEVASETGRTKNVDRRTLTDCLLYFCQIMTEKGYQPMVYFNWGQASRMIYLNELEDYPFWLALYQDRMTFPYRVEMWQYTCTGRVPGIDGDVDIDVYMPDMRASR